MAGFELTFYGRIWVTPEALEIAFKEYLVNELGAGYSPKRLVEIFGNRVTVHTEVKKFVKKKITKETWGRIEYFYNLRNKLVHEKSTANISDEDIQNFREIVESVLRRLFKVRF